MCAAPSDVCMTNVIYHKRSFEHASINICPGIGTLRCQKNCFRLYPSIRTSQLMKKTGCICNLKYKLCEKSIASSIRGFKCVFICKINLAVVQGGIAAGADVMWPDGWRVLMTQQRCVIHNLGRRLQGKKLWKLWRPSLSDLLFRRIQFSPPRMSSSAGILQTGVFSRSREGVVFQTVVIKLSMRVTNLSLSDESELPEVSGSLVSASSHRTDGCWKTEP